MSGNITGKEDISFAVEDLQQDPSSVFAQKTLEMRHEASAGDLLIDLQNLNTPTEAAANGFIQPSAAEIAGSNIYASRKNLTVKSSRGVELDQFEDFVVVDNQTIRLIGTIAALGGALEGEVFTIKVTPLRAGQTIVADSKVMTKSYILPAGQTTLSLGVEFPVNENPFDQVGAIKVTRMREKQYRNPANATASPLITDGDYQEVDAGNGVGTVIEFNVADPFQDNLVMVEFGISFAGDLSLIGDQERLAGTLYNFINAAGPGLGLNPTDFFTASLSEVQRNQFANNVLQLLGDVQALKEVYEPYQDSGEQIFSGVPIFNSSAPTGSLTNRYRWVRRGNRVTLFLSFRYDGVAANNTFFYINFNQLNAPYPQFVNSLAPFQTEQIGGCGSGGWGNGGSVLSPATFQFLGVKDSPTFRLYSVVSPAVVIAEFHGQIEYFTSDV